MSTAMALESAQREAWRDAARAALAGCAGKVSQDAPIGERTRFRTGGHADVLFEPTSADDLAQGLKGLPAGIPIHTIGVGSNMLVRDGGIAGVTVILGRPFKRIEYKGDHLIAGSACLDAAIAEAAARRSLTGLEFFIGIPGTLGGALSMNAGAYGQELKDVLVQAHVLTHRGERTTWSAADLNLAYRYSAPPAPCIYLGAELAAMPGDRDTIRAAMDKISSTRRDSQPISARTGGSTFANPAGHSVWRLIEQAGCRGMRIGGAQVSEKHCNFLLNENQASGHDIERLGETVRQRVFTRSGIKLRWEIRRVGTFALGQEDPAQWEQAL
ncbi:MAG: UDP-N-acetylmuramate dehydrogenase [Pseudomonadota bacterium]